MNLTAGVKGALMPVVNNKVMENLTEKTKTISCLLETSNRRVSKNGNSKYLHIVTFDDNTFIELWASRDDVADESYLAKLVSRELNKGYHLVRNTKMPRSKLVVGYS